MQGIYIGGPDLMTGLHDRMNGSGGVKLPPADPVFDVSAVTMQRRMRFNPLRMLDPENLSTALDQFDTGILYRGAMLWDAMIKRDDTLSFVVPQMTNAIAGKPWGVQVRKDVDDPEAARHAATLKYFWDTVQATDAFDRNVQGGRHLLLKQMGLAYPMRYAVHHLIWRPQPGQTVAVDGAEDAPVLSATLEHVPLWYFENLSGTLRLLRVAGYGLEGEELDWEGEWICTTGEGLMFASSICYTFKRLTFQDWTVFNERYAQQKVVAETPARKGTEPGKAMEQIVAGFNGDQGIVLYETQPGAESPIKLLGPEGTVSVELFEKFLERQDRKMTVHYRGSDLANMSREKDVTGVSAQRDETEALELAHCANIASACRQLDRMVIRFCYGEGVEPLAYFGLPDIDQEDATQLCESAGFLADRGALVDRDAVAERLGIALTENEEDALQAATASAGPDADPDGKPTSTANTARLQRLEEILEETLRTANYDPSEARDTDGEWTSGGATLHPTKKIGDKLHTAEGGELPAHIAKLKLPPAWQHVHVNHDPDAALLAQGYDSKGRLQSVYSDAHHQAAAIAKFARIRELAQKHEAIGAENEKNLQHAESATREAAATLKLIHQTGIRPGSDTDTQAKVKAYGATTLEGRHVIDDGNQVSLQFTGKKGVALNIPVSDPATATMLRVRKAAAGDSGKLFRTDDAALRDYTHTLGGGSFKPKDFRTLKGTTTAAEEIAKRPVPKDAKEYQKAVKDVAKVVSAKLGNTPTVALQSYIDPHVFHSWKQAA